MQPNTIMMMMEVVFIVWFGICMLRPLYAPQENDDENC